MPKDILTIIKEMNRKTNSKKRSLFECRDDITRSLEAGCTLREIWAALVQMGKITYSYSGFIRAVNKHIVTKSNDKFKQQIIPDVVAESPMQNSSEPKRKISVGRMPVIKSNTEPSINLPLDDEPTAGSEMPFNAVEEGLRRLKAGSHFSVKSDSTMRAELIEGSLDEN